MTEERQPNTELRAETLRRLIADDSVSWHQTVAQAYDAGRASVQVEANALIDELKSKATGLADASGFNVTYDVPAGILHKLLAWRDGAAFAASIQEEAERFILPCPICKGEVVTGSTTPLVCMKCSTGLLLVSDRIQAEAQQQIEELKRLVTLQRTYLAQSPDERVKALQLDLDVEKAAMASCIATIGGVIEGNPTGRHNFLRRLRELVAAEKQRDEAFEIHNRFCGENGEPCQVCRLKAEREAK